MHYFRISTILILVLLITAIAYWYVEKNNTQKDNNVAPKEQHVRARMLEQDFIEVPSITLLEASDSIPAMRYTYNLSYPAINLTGHPDLAKNANSIIKTFVLDKLDTFRKNLESTEDPTTDSMQTSDLTLRSSATFLSPTILSLRFDSAEYIAGSAHQNTQTYVLSYDIELGKIIETNDLFASTSTAYPFLSEYSRKVLRDRFTEQTPENFESAVFPGTTPNRDNFKSVSITKEGLLVIFDPYQVASYARGTQEIRIPLAEVETMLSARVRTAIRLAGTNLLEATEELPKKLINNRDF